MRHFLFLAGLLCLGSMLSCSQDPSPPQNILLLVVDTLRADRVGLYGSERPTTPELDRFGQESTVFSRVVAPAPWTLPTMASLLTSTYPSVHGLRSRIEGGRLPRLRKGLMTLTYALHSAGYRTVAVGANPWVNDAGHGLRQDFDRYHALAADSEADALHAIARGIIEDSNPQPLFLYLHYMDVHGPYQGGEDGADLGPVPNRYRHTLTAKERDELPSYLRIEKETELSRYVNAYDQGIRDWDHSFGKFVHWLEESHRLDDFIVVIVSDHGEEFLEHGGWHHGLTVYEDQISVPWVLRSPTLAKRRIEEVVSLIDVAPTLLSLVNIPIPETMIGIDVTAGTDTLKRTLFSQTHIRLGALLREDRSMVVAMREGDEKWILDAEGSRCFDLARDRFELAPSACDPEGVERAAHWAREIETQAARLDQVESFEMTPEQRATLEALGYGE